MQVYLKGARPMMEFLYFITPLLRIGAIVAGMMAAYTFIKNRGGKS